jgi:hypothetical protein
MCGVGWIDASCRKKGPVCGRDLRYFYGGMGDGVRMGSGDVGIVE